jgi:hypothetical protein
VTVRSEQYGAERLEEPQAARRLLECRCHAAKPTSRHQRQRKAPHAHSDADQKDGQCNRRNDIEHIDDHHGTPPFVSRETLLTCHCTRTQRWHRRRCHFTQ